MLSSSQIKSLSAVCPAGVPNEETNKSLKTEAETATKPPAPATKTTRILLVSGIILAGIVTIAAVAAFHCAFVYLSPLVLTILAYCGFSAFVAFGIYYLIIDKAPSPPPLTSTVSTPRKVDQPQQPTKPAPAEKEKVVVIEKTDPEKKEEVVKLEEQIEAGVFCQNFFQIENYGNDLEIPTEKVNLNEMALVTKGSEVPAPKGAIQSAALCSILSTLFFCVAACEGGTLAIASSVVMPLAAWFFATNAGDEEIGSEEEKSSDEKDNQTDSEEDNDSDGESIVSCGSDTTVEIG